jgi:hypothetical protein
VLLVLRFSLLTVQRCAYTCVWHRHHIGHETSKVVKIFVNSQWQNLHSGAAALMYLVSGCI